MPRVCAAIAFVLLLAPNTAFASPTRTAAPTAPSTVMTKWGFLAVKAQLPDSTWTGTAAASRTDLSRVLDALGLSAPGLRVVAVEPAWGGDGCFADAPDPRGLVELADETGRRRIVALMSFVPGYGWYASRTRAFCGEVEVELREDPGLGCGAGAEL